MRDVGEDAVVERQRVGDELVQIGRHRARRRHPRELRELVDQPLQRFDLADDRARALVDERAGARRRVGEMAAQPLGGQLNRRQRILDLVRQPPRHLAPRRHLLRADQRRHVVEHEDQPFGRAALADQRRRDRREMQLLAVALNGDLLGGRLRARRAGPGSSEPGAKRLQIGALEHRARAAGRRCSDRG